VKVRGAIAKREERDAAAEVLRKAEVLLLAGKLRPEDVDRAASNLRQATVDYEDARRIAALGNVLLRIPDPGRVEAQRILDKQPQEPGSGGDGAAADAPPTPPPPRTGGLDELRVALRLRDTSGSRDTSGGEQRPRSAASRDPSAASRDPSAGAPPQSESPSESLLPSGARVVTLKDVAIGLVFVLQARYLSFNFNFNLTLTFMLPGPLPCWLGLHSHGHGHGHGHGMDMDMAWTWTWTWS